MLDKLLEVTNIDKSEYLQVSGYTEEEFNTFGDKPPRQAVNFIYLMVANRKLQQRQRTVVHITVDPASWNASQEDLVNLTREFLTNGVISTHEGVRVNAFDVGDIVSISTTLADVEQNLEEKLFNPLRQE